MHSEVSDERARFQREVIALARISHPNVLPVFDVSTDPDDPYLVLNYCPDGTLADRLQAGPLTLAETRELARQTSAGLAAMHAASVIHRDVKPSNILRLRDRWLVGDLGIARLDDQAALTETGARIGSRNTGRRETARGQECTPAVDVYGGLGCVLYEALTGQKVFAGGSPVATGFLHADDAPTPVAVAHRASRSRAGDAGRANAGQGPRSPPDCCDDPPSPRHAGPGHRNPDSAGLGAERRRHCPPDCPTADGHRSNPPLPTGRRASRTGAVQARNAADSS